MLEVNDSGSAPLQVWWGQTMTCRHSGAPFALGCCPTLYAQPPGHQQQSRRWPCASRSCSQCEASDCSEHAQTKNLSCRAPACQMCCRQIDLERGREGERRNGEKREKGGREERQIMPCIWVSK